MILKISQPPGAAAKRIRHIRQTLGKRTASTVSVRAMKAASRNMYGHRTTLPREIIQHAPVGTVNAPRRLAADWACRRRRARRRLDGDVLGCWNHQRHSERSWNERQQGRGHGSEHHGCESMYLSDLPSEYKSGGTGFAGEPRVQPPLTDGNEKPSVPCLWPANFEGRPLHLSGPVRRDGYCGQSATLCRQRAASSPFMCKAGAATMPTPQPLIRAAYGFRRKHVATTNRHSARHGRSCESAAV